MFSVKGQMVNTRSLSQSLCHCSVKAARQFVKELVWLHNKQKVTHTHTHTHTHKQAYSWTVKIFNFV